MGRLCCLLLTIVLSQGGCAKPAEKSVSDTKRDEFNLPLVIHIDVPDVPPEIEKPSPPMSEEPESH